MCMVAGANGGMISIQGGIYVPVPFGQIIEVETGRTPIRLVEVTPTRSAIARRYMIRLRRDDFEDSHELAKLAATAHVSPEQFRREFEYLMAAEPPPLAMDELGERVPIPDGAETRRRGPG